ncbi:competence type IV pilus minor pilin ComGG [Bacillus sp. DTU_2020_1000418_1_SI_GHA_SEK_038]|uniref:competence type IV pilus minor pilin ComGG n=1 Tax=Bacillus sp. DTU_2020_1000418_1_SI_GHA_SEK_038 TaxID=3077585 RepID=UPI0028E62BB7|nr:competence type IV pilus minor pilin ComGG [Bacillus sp. DTU_2020_1000418_1_SI_GHA_SEK_038]WNS74213.1 competence type IV pilus minor pilin ComGG [Bacillus sp. DTU_2020_1000418_1_SI_GHA_SEK_038]
MLQNEKGFTYPLTFTIILLVALLLTMHIEFYLTEIRFLQESQTLLKQEYYLISSLKRIEDILLTEDEDQYTGVFSFSDGEVHYETAKITDTLLMSTFNLRIGTNIEMLAYGYFDKEEGKMIKWIEKN